MRLFAAAVVAIAGLLASLGSAWGQPEPCRIVLGFAALRDQVGTAKVGTCLEEEHFNLENGNSEQRTSGGLMVWRKVDNFTAFTDGATTWVNGPEGVQSRPNAERFAWEKDPVQSTTARSSGAATSAAPAASPASAPRAAASPVIMSADAGTTSSSGIGTSASAEVAQAAPTATSTATKPPTSTATPTKVTTPTPTPNPLEVKFSEKPDDVDAGNDAKFEVETNGKKGTCVLVVTFRNTPAANLGSKDIKDGHCEWKFTLAVDTKTGKATAEVTVTADGGTAKVEDSFEVKKGDTTYAGNIEIEIEPDELPEKVNVGEQFEISINTSLKNRGSCEMAIAWPQVAPTGGEAKTPDGRGRCSWTMTVPATITKNGKATITVVARRKGSDLRVLTHEFEVRKS